MGNTNMELGNSFKCPNTFKINCYEKQFTIILRNYRTTFYSVVFSLTLLSLFLCKIDKLNTYTHKT